MAATIVWSEHQQRIFSFALEGAGHGLVEATAGAGKTTVIVETCRRLLAGVSPARILYVTFSRRLADEAGEKLGPLRGVDVSTLHALGHRMIKERWSQYSRKRVQRYKTSRLLSASLATRWGSYWTQPRGKRPRLVSAPHLRSDPLAAWLLFDLKGNTRPLETAVTQAVDAARVAALDPRADDYRAALERECGRRSIDLAPGEASIELLDVARRIHLAGLQAIDPKTRGAMTGEIDFTDMLTGPVFHDLRCETPYDWVVLDEAQDLSPASAGMLQILAPADGSGARLLAVGDRDQSIMGFAGADSRSMDRIAREWSCEQMGLPITYRCPTSHVALARRLALRIEARPAAPEGSIEEATVEQLAADVEPGDLILCRFNAPLMGLCLSLIRRGVQARLFGRDIGSQLSAHAQSAQDRYPGESLPEALRLFADARVEALRAEEPDIDDEDIRVTLICDTEEALQVLLREMGERASLDDLSRKLRELFADEGAAVWCSSVHRSKGLEADRVWIARPDALPLARTDDDEAERCVAFVAVTRAKRDLRLLTDTGSPSWLFAQALASGGADNDDGGVLEHDGRDEDLMGDETKTPQEAAEGTVEEADDSRDPTPVEHDTETIGAAREALDQRQRRTLDDLPPWPVASVPQRLKSLRLWADLSQGQLAKRAEVSRRTIVNLEADSDDWQRTSVARLVAVCRALGVTLAELVAGRL